MAEDEGGSGGSRRLLVTVLPGVLTALAALVTATVALIGFLNRDGDEESGISPTTAQSAQPEVELLSPKQGRVPWKTPVVLRYSNIDEDSDLWLVEHTDKYYPHPGCPGERPTVERAPGQQSGTWDETIEIGTKDTPARAPFELLVLLTSEQASQLLSKQIRGWCNPAPWPGISELPDMNAEVKASVVVLR